MKARRLVGINRRAYAERLEGKTHGDSVPVCLRDHGSRRNHP